MVKDRKSNPIRYWIVEIDSHSFSKFDAIYRIAATTEKAAMKKALDRFQDQDKRNVVSSLEMTDHAAELMESAGWSGKEGEDFAWQVVTEGWSEPANDNRWIRGEMIVREVSIDQDFRRYCNENGYVLYKNYVYDDNWDPIYYCPHCDYICYREFCNSCGYHTVPFSEDTLFERYMKDTWGSIRPDNIGRSSSPIPSRNRKLTLRRK